MSKVYKTKKMVVKKNIRASSRGELIERFTKWANRLHYDHSISLLLWGIIGDVPVEVPEGESEQDIPAHVVQ
jgi:hypothetical protein